MEIKGLKTYKIYFNKPSIKNKLISSRFILRNKLYSNNIIIRKKVRFIIRRFE